MNRVQQDFAARAEEVMRYVRFLRTFDDNDLVAGVSHFRPSDWSPFERDALFKTMKANVFLLLYNLVESTIKNAIEAIFDEFRLRGTSFDSCRVEVRRIVLSNLRRHKVDKILPSLATISVDVIAETFVKNDLFSGNVDGRSVRRLAAEYGFRPPSKKSDQLLVVKTSRNDLAHGNKSFSDVGRDYDLVRLDDIMREVIAFLEEVLTNVADYLATRSYLSGPSDPSSEQS